MAEISQKQAASVCTAELAGFVFCLKVFLQKGEGARDTRTPVIIFITFLAAQDCNYLCKLISSNSLYSQNGLYLSDV